MVSKRIKRQRRHKRVRGKIIGTAKIPRLCVFRSNKHIYVQLIDDVEGKTLVSASDLDIKAKPKKQTKNKKTEESQGPLLGKELIAYQVGQIIAQKVLNLTTGKTGKKIEKVVFDRGGYKYHGRVKAVARGAREGGLKF